MQSFPSYQPGQLGRTGFNRGRARGRFGRASRPQCQICNPVENVTRRCFYRYDDDEGASSQQSQIYYDESNARQAIVHKYPGNVPYLSHVGPHANLTTMVATPHTVADQAWYPNSGASAYMTNDATKLLHAQPTMVQVE